MKDQGYQVPGMSRREIRYLADQLRARLGLQAQAPFPIIEVYDVLDRLVPGFEYQICEAQEMGEDHGLTFPQRRLIKIREDVYDRAAEGYGRDRLTMGHELGHLFLHADIAFARRPSGGILKAYESSEWQASCFGGELLMSHQHVGVCSCPEDMQRVFGVSGDAADFQWGVFQREGIIKIA